LFPARAIPNSQLLRRRITDLNTDPPQLNSTQLQSLRATKAIAPSRVALTAKPALRRRTANVTAKALYFPTDTEYIASVGADYPDAGIANWEEARCLFSDHGYNILDIRCEAEVENIGNFPRQLPSDHNPNTGGRFFEVPLINAKSQYDSEAGKKNDEEPNQEPRLHH